MGAGSGRPLAGPAPMQREAAQGWISRTSRSSSVPGVGKAEHWATALSREGRRVLDRPLTNDANGEDRLREVYQRLQAKGQVLVVVDQPAAIRGPGGGSGHGHHRGLPARTVHETHRRPGTG